MSIVGGSSVGHQWDILFEPLDVGPTIHTKATQEAKRDHSVIEEVSLLSRCGLHSYFLSFHEPIVYFHDQAPLKLEEFVESQEIQVKATVE